MAKSHNRPRRARIAYALISLVLAVLLGGIIFAVQMSAEQQASFERALVSLSNLDVGSALSEMGVVGGDTSANSGGCLPNPREPIGRIPQQLHLRKEHVQIDSWKDKYGNMQDTEPIIVQGGGGSGKGRANSTNSSSSGIESGNVAVDAAFVLNKESSALNPIASGGDDNDEGGAHSNSRRVRNYDDDAYREDPLVKAKFAVWEKEQAAVKAAKANAVVVDVPVTAAADGKKSAPSGSTSNTNKRNFYDPTPNVKPLNTTFYSYLKGYKDDMVPLYPESLKDYRHTYGNCKGNFRYNTEYSKIATMTAGNRDTFARLWPNMPDRRTKFPTEHERCHAVMIRQLGILTSILEHHNMTNWFISHATLLGAVRHGGMIPWDVDIDVVMTRTTTKFLRKMWRREFPRDMFLQSERTDPSFHLWIGEDRGMRIKDRYSGFHGFDFTHYSPKTRKKKRIRRYQNGAGVDIIPINRVSKKGDWSTRDRMKVFHNYFNASDVFPTSKICFENIEVRAPKDPIWFLDLIYGKDRWRELPEDPILAQPTAFPCVSTTPQWGSAWNLKWELDHPMAANKSAVYPKYVPYTATAEEEARAKALAMKEQRMVAAASPALNSAVTDGGGRKKFASINKNGQQEQTEPGDVPQPTTPAKTAGKAPFDPLADPNKQRTVYPYAGAKLFPRADPHGTYKEDNVHPYMKYDAQGRERYNLVPNWDEAA